MRQLIGMQGRDGGSWMEKRGRHSGELVYDVRDARKVVDDVGDARKVVDN